VSDIVMVVVVIGIVGWLLMRGGRPNGTSGAAPPGTTLGGSATWSPTQTPAPVEPDLDRVGDEHFVEGFVVGRYVTLAEQERLRARDRAAFEAALPDDDAWAHGGGDVLGGPGGSTDGGLDEDGSDVAGFSVDGFSVDGADLDEHAADGDGSFDGWGLGDDTGFDGFDDDW
jgi:hypothetical protein